MRILVACEESGVVREAFKAHGHDAWSCDLLPSRIPGNHLQRFVEDVIDQSWDMMIAFPPCDHICVSGALHFSSKRADGRQQAGIAFFMKLANCGIPAICIENPVGIMSTLWRKPDQFINPYQFGHDAAKKTGLWLHNLPALKPTKRTPGRLVIWNGKTVERWANQTDSGQNRLGPSETRKRDRAETYQGIADAMACQWGKAALEVGKI